MADNSTFTLVNCDLTKSLAIAFGATRKAVGYYADEKEFILFWTETDKATLFPVPLDQTMLQPMVKEWLENVAAYGSIPNIDGDSSRGWTISTGGWGHVDDYGWQSFARITPTWALHGK